MSSEHNIESVTFSAQYPGKCVHVIQPEETYNDYKPRYAPDAPLRILPDVVLLEADGSIVVQTNAHGFHGPEIDFSKKLVAVWGDSATEGLYPGWVHGLGAFFPDFHFVNGGIAGDSFPRTGMRALAANRKLDIDYNILLPGWHTGVEEMRYWFNLLIQTLPNVILCTQPSAFNDVMVQCSVADLVIRKPEEKRFSPGLHSRQLMQEYYTRITAFNELTHTFSLDLEGRERAAAPVIDLYTPFRTHDDIDYFLNFYDCFHLRKPVYPALQQVLAAGLRPILSATSAEMTEEERNSRLTHINAGLAIAYSRLGDESEFEKAIARIDIDSLRSSKLYRDLAPLLKRHGETWNQQGEDLYSEGDSDGALKYFLLAERYAPDMAAVHNNLGVVYWGLEMFEESLIHFMHALEIDAMDREAILNFCAVAMQTQFSPLAEKVCIHYLRARPSDPVVTGVLTELRKAA